MLKSFKYKGNLIMYSRNNRLKSVLLGLAIFMGLLLITAPVTQAQTWTPLPPYNFLWPLWSPPLSPSNPLTGLPIPIVSDLKPSTVLSVQPGLTWDPNLKYPWLLYNTLNGLAYYDSEKKSINLWPPPDLIDPLTGLPAPIGLSTIAFSTLLPTGTAWLGTNVPLGNEVFMKGPDRRGPFPLMEISPQ